MTTPPFQLKALDHVVLRVKDLAAMRDFYCNVLGCRVEKVQEAIGLWQLRAGNALIDLLHDADAVPSPAANMDHFCLTIDPFDLPRLQTYLQAAGANIGTAGNRNGAQGIGPSLYVYDPENNKVELKGPSPAQ